MTALLGEDVGQAIRAEVAAAESTSALTTQLTSITQQLQQLQTINQTQIADDRGEHAAR